MEGSPCTRQQGGQRLAPDDAGVECERACTPQPILVMSDVQLVLAQIEDPGAPEAYIDADEHLHCLPKPHRFDDQRQFALIAPHAPDPAPVAAGLLGSELALFAYDRRYALPRQEQGSAQPDDAASHDDDVGGRWLRSR